MAAPLVENHVLNEVGAASSILVGVPSGSGDLLLAFLAQGSIRTFTAHGSWTDCGLGQLANTSPGTTVNILLRQASAEPADYTFAWTGGTTQCVGAILRISGADLSGGLLACRSGTPAASVVNTGSPTQAVSPSMDTAHADALVLRFESFDSSGAAITENTGYPASHTGLFRVNDELGSDANDVIAGIAHTSQAGIGATGAATWGAIGGTPTNLKYIAATLAIKPVVAVAEKVPLRVRPPSRVIIPRYLMES